MRARSRELELAVTIARQLGFSVERMRVGEAKELLLKESKHRIKNALATVQAIAGQTLRNAPHQDLERFLGRLQALDKAHDLLTADDWNEVALGEVVRRALIPFEPCGSGRVVIDGPSAALPARKSLMLTLCLHELATKAAKYNALSNSSGKVYVGWELTGEGGDRRVKLTWRERGGPVVSAPGRKGLGSLLIEQSLGGQGESRLEFSPEGLWCCLHLSFQ
jgi:two-component sensor histidine kinase